MGIFSKGVILQQNKEPALSRPVQEFFNAGGNRVSIGLPPVEDLQQVTGDRLLKLARDAKITDENDGRLLYDKLLQMRLQKATMVVMDAVDDEPYVSSQMACLLHKTEQAVGGLKLAARVLGVEKMAIAVYKNINDLAVKIPRSIQSIPVKRVTGRYPAQYRIRDLFDPQEKLAVVGAGALIHLYRALTENIQQTTCFVTVAGNCIGNPTNLEVSIGMTAMQLLERCGLIRNPSRIIVGGTMTGVSVIDPDKTLITANTRALLAFRDDVKDQHYQCIGCGRCVQVCPESLNPCYIRRLYEKRYFAQLALYDPQRCMECATCSYVCPSKLELADTMHLVKKHLQALQQKGGDAQ